VNGKIVTVSGNDLSSPTEGFKSRDITVGDQTCLCLHVLCQLFTSWMVQGSNPSGGEIFCTHRDWP
jgi:hypothetical protein